MRQSAQNLSGLLNQLLIFPCLILLLWTWQVINYHNLFFKINHLLRGDKNEVSVAMLLHLNLQQIVSPEGLQEERAF